ncbi:MAG: hypothetical protein J0I06_15700 [Planctomycetes bacterium]|nr:hypothetical protein [Planctomycetota bacterium]
MKKRLLCLGLVAAVTQLFATGCIFHPVARWRANHPCGVCTGCHPGLHPIQSRRVVLGEPVGPAVGPVVGSPPCHGCNSGAPGVPVVAGRGPGELITVTNPPAGYPSIGYPTPITPGPTVVPQYELPNPMPVPKSGENK